MENTKITSGEWVVETDNKPYEYEVTARNEHGQIVVPTFEEAKANAKLISQAPKLLEQLKKNHEIILNMYCKIDVSHTELLQEARSEMVKILELIDQATK